MDSASPAPGGPASSAPDAGPPTTMAPAAAALVGALAVAGCFGQYVRASFEYREELAGYGLPLLPLSLDGEVALALMILIPATAFVYCGWIAAANQNARALSPGRVRISPTWSVLGLFIPLVQVIVPPLALAQIWAASAARDPARSRATIVLLPIWWVAWTIMLGAPIVGDLAHQWFGVERIGGAPKTSTGSLLFGGSLLVAGLTMSAIVLTIDRMQRRGWAHRPAPDATGR